MLKDSGALITNTHVVLTSEKHSDKYINKDALYPHTEFSSRIGELFATAHENLDIDVVAAPALGGIVLSQWTSYHLSRIKGLEVLGVYTEKDAESNQVFKRGYDKLVKNKKVLVVEDSTTTGGSVAKVVNTVREGGGEVVAVAVMVNRNPEEVTSKMFAAPFSSLAVLKAEAWDAKVCKLCSKGIPVNTTVGHGKKFLEKQREKQRLSSKNA
jgi:orotate phosphoribosyltransferase